jgi:hypothetical protein
VVTSFERNDRCTVVRVDKREIIGTHLSQTTGVLINEGGLKDRINGTCRREVNVTVVSVGAVKASVSIGASETFDNR